MRYAEPQSRSTVSRGTPPVPPHLLIVGGGLDLPQRARAAWPGLRTSVICRTGTLSRLRDPDRIERLVVLPRDAPAAEWVRAARYVDRVAPVDRLVNYTERDTDKTAAIGAALGLATPGAETYRLISDKVAMRERLAAAGIDDTPARAVRTAEEVRRFARHAGYPLICKPASGVGSRGVRRIDRPGDIRPALEWGRAAAPALDHATLMVERFHRGDEYSVEALSENGVHRIAVIVRKFSEPEHFVELGHVLPADLDEAVSDRITGFVPAVLDALGVRDGVTHTEVIDTGDRVRIVETHLRPAGDEIPYMLAGAGGIDLIEALARQSAGLPALGGHPGDRLRPGTGRYAAIRYARPAGTGRIRAVHGLDQARAVAGVAEVHILAEAGTTIESTAGSGSRAAYAWATGPTAAVACERAGAAVGALRFEMTPARPVVGAGRTDDPECSAAVAGG